jgi:hypothetical protein
MKAPVFAAPIAVRHVSEYFGEGKKIGAFLLITGL